MGHDVCLVYLEKLFLIGNVYLWFLFRDSLSAYHSHILKDTMATENSLLLRKMYSKRVELKPNEAH